MEQRKVIEVASSANDQAVPAFGNSVFNLIATVAASASIEKKSKRRNKKIKKKKKKIQNQNQAVAVVVSDNAPGDTVTGQEHMSSSKDVSTVVATKAKSVDIQDNIVLRNLLRGWRYFDSPDNEFETCYNCGEEGHTVTHCTAQKRKRRPCYLCGATEHNANRCKQSRNCHICRGQGHLAKACPSKHKGRFISSKFFCLRCGNSGHDMFSCSNDYSPDDLKDVQCYVCKAFGHLCCADFLNCGKKKVSCCKCGEIGHLGSQSHYAYQGLSVKGCSRAVNSTGSKSAPCKDLSTNGSNQSQGDISGSKSTGALKSTSCYGCGEEGHLVKQCTKSSKPTAKQNVDVFSTPTQNLPKKRKALSTPSHNYGNNEKRMFERRDGAPVVEGRAQKLRVQNINQQNILYRDPSVNTFMSPATPVTPNYLIPTPNAFGNLDYSQYSQQSPNFLGIPNTQAYQQQHFQQIFNYHQRTPNVHPQYHPQQGYNEYPATPNSQAYHQRQQILQYSQGTPSVHPQYYPQQHVYNHHPIAPNSPLYHQHQPRFSSPWYGNS
ncbi:Zinc finger, CCHC-type [Dillenia turbinata]|uniref:Zinc finger, CCHC-type n=1 Tax=Dillenia turbinata TaxID=194707 RepID=A0AAN8W638_9MAGN